MAYHNWDSDDDSVAFPSLSSFEKGFCPKHRNIMRAVCITCYIPLCRVGVDEHSRNLNCRICYPEAEPELYRMMVVELLEDIKVFLDEDFRVEHYYDLEEIYQKMLFEMQQGGSVDAVCLRTFNEAVDVLRFCRIRAALPADPEFFDAADQLQFNFDNLNIADPQQGVPEPATNNDGTSYYQCSWIGNMDTAYLENYENQRIPVSGYSPDDDDNDTHSAGHRSVHATAHGRSRQGAANVPVHVGPCRHAPYFLGDSRHNFRANTSPVRRGMVLGNRRPAGRRRSRRSLTDDASQAAALPDMSLDRQNQHHYAASAGRRRHTEPISMPGRYHETQRRYRESMPSEGRRDQLIGIPSPMETGAAESGPSLQVNIYTSSIPEAATPGACLMSPHSHTTNTYDLLMFAYGDTTMMGVQQAGESYTSTGSSVVSFASFRQTPCKHRLAASASLCMDDSCLGTQYESSL